ncbi:hypothetical protein [Actinomadura hibisca]|uniref:hypothetical protein n=1 Tax=Actinomadura hibisca TaxID=68565 RepID=UPI000B25A2BC|nr:hypothetical protein [Actinomadura hibisca]
MTQHTDEAIDDIARLLIEAADLHGTDAGGLARSIPDEVLTSVYRRVLENLAHRAEDT